MAQDSDAQSDLDRMRSICLALPEVTERLSHGAPTWFVRDKKTFVQFWTHGHHGNEFPHFWCAAPAGMQEVLVEADPDVYFRPPYVGHRGWVAVRLDRGLPWDEANDLCRAAYRTIAPTSLVARLDAEEGR